MHTQLKAVLERLGARLQPYRSKLPADALPLGLLLLTTLAVFVPFTPTMPAPTLDDSWGIGINQAIGQGLVFGKDVIFTFGPYVSLFNHQYHPATDTLMLFGSTYLALAYWLALVCIVRQARPFLPWVLFAVLGAFMTSHDALLLSYPLLVGVVACRRPQPSSRRHEWILIALCTPFGLLPLIKGSIGALGALIGGIIIAQLALEKRWRVAGAIVGAAVVAMLMFWIAAHQPVLALPGYFRSMLPIISGYTQAMALPGARKEIVLFILAAVALLLGAGFDETQERRPRRFLWGIYLAFLFITFKAGFVRHDAHGALCGLAVVIGALVWVGTTPSKFALPVLLSSMLVWLVTDADHVKTSTAGVISNVKLTYGGMYRGLKRRLVGGGWKKEFDARMDEIRTETAVPRLGGTWDVYPYDQAVLLASGNRYNPRPVLQSYSVYTPYLSDANVAHLEGPDAPDHILFRIATVDLRLPALDDGASWPALLRRYVPDGLARAQVVLSRRPVDAPAEITTIGTGTYALGDRVPIPKTDGFVFAKIDLDTSAWGSLANIFYKPDGLVITLWFANGTERTYRYIAEMGQLGVLISPLVENTTEFIALYGATAYLDSKRVVAFAISPGSPEPDHQHQSARGWASSFAVTFQRIPAPSDPGIKRFFHFDSLVTGPFDADTMPCNGNLESVNGTKGALTELTARGVLEVRGWLTDTVGSTAMPVVVLTASSGQRWLGMTRRVARPDVATYLKTPEMGASGYVTSLDVSGIAGTYALDVGIFDGTKLQLCAGPSRKVSITPLSP